jgi:7tm Odorant receptor
LVGEFLFKLNFFLHNFDKLNFFFPSDSLLYALITMITMEFDILKDDLMNLKLPPKGDGLEIIRNFSDRHNKLLGLGEKLQNIFALSFFFSCTISSLVLCFVAFQLSRASDVSTYSLYVPYLSLMAGQILLLCFHGQKMINASQSVADGVYNCGWENFDDESFKRQLLLIIIRSQRPKKLTALNFADVTLGSFTSVN